MSIKLSQYTHKHTHTQGLERSYQAKKHLYNWTRAVQELFVKWLFFFFKLAVITIRIESQKGLKLKNLYIPISLGLSGS